MDFKKKLFTEKEEAMILAAGRGKRMRHKTLFTAKPLIILNDISLLEFNLKKLTNAGIKKCIVNSNYKHISIRNFLKIYSLKNKYPKTKMSHEETVLETGGGIKNALPLFNKNKILAINGDSLLINKTKDCPVKKLYTNFNDSMDVLLLLVPKKNSIGYQGNGDFIRNNKRNIFRIQRKKSIGYSDLVFCGWQLLRKDIFNKIDRNYFSLNLIYDVAQKKNRLYGTIFNGSFLHIGDPRSYLFVNNQLNSKKLSLL